MSYQSTRFLSTPSARRATSALGFFNLQGVISIHALREEGDRGPPSMRLSKALFLSTPSARRATPRGQRKPPAGRDFYPRPPRGGRLYVTNGFIAYKIFLSTPSARRATFFRGLGVPPTGISIHALREEGDSRSCCNKRSIPDFYPRPPRGGRRSTPRELVRV